MKKTSVIVSLIITFCGIVIFACNKLSPDPENTKTPSPQKLEEPITVRAKTSPSSAATMVIENILDEVKVTTTANTATESDKYGIYTPSGVTFTNGEIFLDQNSAAWWLVPFDNTKQPLLMIAGGSSGALAKTYCICEEGPSSSSHNTCDFVNSPMRFCAPYPSTSTCTNCDMMECKTRPTTDSPWTEGEKASYAFVNSNKLRFNGVLYTAPL